MSARKRESLLWVQDLSGKPMSTIGFERRHNMAFRIEDEEAFVRAMSEEIPPPPPGAAKLRAANAGLALV